MKRRNRIMCKLCLDIIESKHTYDDVTCSCGAIGVDGGNDYFKRSGNSENMIELSFPESLVYVVSKPEPKIDMKEEHVEPVSIWRLANKLPKQRGELYLKTRYGIERGYFDFARQKFVYVDVSLDNGLGVRYGSEDYVEEWCYLTDFINSFNRMQKDILELKKQIRG